MKRNRQRSRKPKSKPGKTTRRPRPLPAGRYLMSNMEAEMLGSLAISGMIFRYKPKAYTVGEV